MDQLVFNFRFLFLLKGYNTMSNPKKANRKPLDLNSSSLLEKSSNKKNKEKKSKLDINKYMIHYFFK
jgi:hypothetical protein